MSAFLKELDLARKARLNTLIMGDPGLGKTAAITQLAKENGAALVTLILSIREPSDLGGLPMLVGEKDSNQGVRLCAPQWVYFLKQAAAKGQPTILFIDELTTAAPSLQAAALRVVNEKYVGEEKLPDNIWIVAAANDVSIAANGTELSPPLANRFYHTSVKYDNKEFCLNFPSYWGDAPQISGFSVADMKAWQDARNRIAGFLNSNPAVGHKLPKEQSEMSKAWPSPRTWDYASRVLALTPNYEDAVQVMAGCVGHGATMEFISWNKNVDLPDPEELLKNPDKWNYTKENKKRGDITFAILGSVHSAFTANQTQSRWAAAWKIYSKVLEAGQPDIVAQWAAQLLKGFKPGGNLVIPPEAAKFTQLFKASGILAG
jgi:hypothetical protein